MTDKKEFQISNIDPKQYTYQLPEELIAKFPSAERGKSRMLAFKNGHISRHLFSDIGDFIDDGSLLMFNNTKVIPARLSQRNRRFDRSIFVGACTAQQNYE